jgi:hypothetical protein
MVHRALRLAVTLSSALVVTACIEPVPAPSDTTTDISAVDGTTDTSGGCVDDRACDDGDPCTFDLCNPSTGLCEYLGVPVAEPGVPADPAQLPWPGDCATNLDCDDGDACTEDRCEPVADECGVMSGVSMCVRRAIPGCVAPCRTDADCDDGDPCTADHCGGTCWFEPMAGCEAGCVLEGATSVADTGHGVGAGAPVRAYGEASMFQGDMGCTDDGICNCDGSAALADATRQLRLKPGAPNMPPGDTWYCTSRDGATPPMTCQPVHAGVSYLVWGAAAYSWEGRGGDPAGALMPASDAIAVEGFCVLPTADGLSGRWRGVLDGQWGWSPLGFEGVIETDATGNLVLGISGAHCRDAACTEEEAAQRLPDQRAPIQLLDVGLRVDIKYQDSFDGEIAARLFGARNTYGGRWVPRAMATGPAWGSAEGGSTPPPSQEGGGEMDVAPLPEGTLTLERLAPADVSAPCR